MRALMARYGYRNIRTPIVEPTALFVRGLGEVTDIVEKEMYSFEDRLNGEQLTLRPETTAGMVRAVIEHNAAVRRPQAPVTTWARCSATSGPQKGRYRQFHQLGVEALGFAGPGRGRRDDPAGARALARAGPGRGQTCGWKSTAWASPTSAARTAPR